MGDAADQRALQRLIVGCVVVLVDINIQTFDVLLDTVGYLILANSAGRLARFEPTFVRLRETSVAAAVLAGVMSLASIPEANRISSNTRSIDANVGFNLRVPATGDLSGLDLTRELTHLALGACGWILVWYLVASLGRLAEHAESADLARSLNGVRTPLAVALPSSALLFNAGELPNLDLLSVPGVLMFVVAVVFGVRALWLVRRAGREIQPNAVERPDEALRAPIWLFALASATVVMAAAVAATA